MNLISQPKSHHDFHSATHLRLLMTLLVVMTLAFSSVLLHAQVLAFPGAEGYGATATGGRGQPAIAVTNHNDDGPGSFRDAARHANTTIVFQVSGIIHLKSNMNLASNLTIAGQTAPGAGITVADAKVSMTGSSNIIIRYMRFRGGLAESPKVSSLNLADAGSVMLDHLSIEWGRWDNIQANGNHDSTIQNSIIGEGIIPQRFGCLCESDYLSLVRNLWIHNKSRNPKGKGHIQYVNNVIYNWGVAGYVGGHSATGHYADIIGNYFIKGPSSSDSFIGEFTKTDHTYQANNFVDLNLNGKLDGRPASNADFEHVNADLMTHPFAKPEIRVRIEPATKIVDEVANDAGDSLCRDTVDTRLVGDLLSFGTKGHFIADPSEVGGFPEVIEEKSETDSDGDGIPDTWERKHHLDPHNPADAQEIDPRIHYSYLELYINGLVQHPAKNRCGNR